MRRLFCYIRAIPFFIRSGYWVPHVYGDETKETGIVITTENSFRISDNLTHNEKETVHPKATILRNKCIYCGHETVSWYDREPYHIQ